MFSLIRFFLVGGNTLLKMETIEIKKQVAKFNKVLADPRNKNLCRKKRGHLVEKLEKTQSQRIQNLKAFLNNFDFDQLPTTKN